MNANEDMRNDPHLREIVRVNLLHKAYECDQIAFHIRELKRLTAKSRWEGSKTKSAIFDLEYYLPSSAELRERSNNETYLGNAAAFGHDI